MTDRSRLVALSFLMLFVELALIRWTGAEVVYLSYFSNFVLLGSFLGIGIGFLRAKSPPNLFAYSCVLLALLIGFVAAFPTTVDRSGSQLIYFGELHPTGLPIWIALPVIFAAVAVVMASIAQGVARTFALFDPLEAYRLDILGSLAGIVAFTLVSFAGAPPIVWGAIVSLVFVVLYWPSVTLLQGAGAIGIVLALTPVSFDHSTFWSPYYKVELRPSVPGWTAIAVNGVPHQYMTAARNLLHTIYAVPYQRLRRNPPDRVLIIGAGNGRDTSLALLGGAKHIDAVEIDPRIVELGRRLHPDRPYEDSRVTVYVDDGRAFLERTRNKYDLILFALPDSLTLISGQSSLRLESYLFTVEAMRRARDRLRPDGVFAMYNYYRESWLVDRFAQTLATVYGWPPCIDVAPGEGHLAALTIGFARDNVVCGTVWSPREAVVPLPVNDDYPFAYLRDRSIPILYLWTLALIALASIALVRISGGPFRDMRAYVDLFFMGAAFLLLETKNVVQFALLFGSTWLVNALVFFGILSAVFLAVEVARRVRFKQPLWLYGALFVALVVAWLVTPASLLALAAPVRLAAAISLAFGPVFLANLIFADRFRSAASSTVAFGANLVGAMCGGILEYASLIVGYRSLLIVIALLYVLAFVFERLAVRRDQAIAIPQSVPAS